MSDSNENDILDQQKLIMLEIEKLVSENISSKKKNIELENIIVDLKKNLITSNNQSKF